ncbi:MAG TPA: hypothetical protein VHC22_15625 [Pirellulales bacterium]|nr:hypothetical protein [Pirellulales bacterium]
MPNQFSLRLLLVAVGVLCVALSLPRYPVLCAILFVIGAYFGFAILGGKLIIWILGSLVAVHGP